MRGRRCRNFSGVREKRTKQRMHLTTIYKPLGKAIRSGLFRLARYSRPLVVFVTMG
ncbi:hypothetical protein FB555_000394 [Alpinimonas psychrophila]|uniref:Uncharacterized protein n=1 Tax=Alpinimonas psychrophila TaxID=748908 RepID=A0A7W3JS95_9MICO|nr:hypothetical protein [Alpinimonas psychrophila]